MYNIKNILHYFLTGLLELPKIIISIIIHFFYGLITTIIIFPKYFIIGLKTIFTPKEKRLTSNKQKKLPLMMALSITVYLVCVFILSRWSVQQLKLKYLSDTIQNDTDTIIKEETITPPNNNQDSNTDTPDEENPTPNQNQQQVYYPNDYWDYINVPLISVDFNNLLRKNPDTVGWIKIDNTKVNYPVVQTTNNTYYLNHAFNKTANAGGWIYADFRANFNNFDKNTIIYAHNLTNKTMFGSLTETLKPYWYTNPNNRYIKISTPNSNTIWTIFSIYKTTPTIDYIKTNFTNTNYQEWLNAMKSKSIYDFGITPTESDKILTLSTCDDTGTQRIVIQAKMVSINYR